MHYPKRILVRRLELTTYIGHDNVERADPVRGDKEQVVLIDLVQIPHLAPCQKFESRTIAVYKGSHGIEMVAICCLLLTEVSAAAASNSTLIPPTSRMQ